MGKGWEKCDSWDNVQKIICVRYWVREIRGKVVTKLRKMCENCKKSKISEQIQISNCYDRY